MKRFLLICISLSCSLLSLASITEKEKIIELAKVYKSFMFRDEPSKDVFRDMRVDVPASLKRTVDFLAQGITTNNKLLRKDFLSLPDDVTLRSLYLIDKVNSNLIADEPKDNVAFLDSVEKLTVTRNEMVDNYYSLLFCSVGNKDKPFDLSGIDFKVKDYNLANETEKGIFFLRCMRFCNSQIWGLINIAKPMNTKGAYDEIRKFPKFNGQPYYQYNDFTFPDFKRVISTEDGLESYKSHFIDKYYEVLLYHLLCLRKEGGTEKEITDLLLGSILKERRLYKYTTYKESIEGLFSEVLQYDKRNIDCEDKWVIYRPDSSGNYMLGFIYVDEEAGLTYHRLGTFVINESGTFVRKEEKELDKVSIKARLEPSNEKRLAVIPESRYKELGIEKYPTWLKYYKTDEDSVARLVKWGFMYNAWDKCDKALTYLEKAQQREPHYKGLAMELVFSYNALAQYDKALVVLKSSPEAKAAPCYYYKEYAFAEMHLEHIEEAAAICKEGIPLCGDAKLKEEMSFNMASRYYKKKDKEHFKTWTDEAKKWAEGTDDYVKSLDKMAELLDNPDAK